MKPIRNSSRPIFSKMFVITALVLATLTVVPQHATGFGSRTATCGLDDSMSMLSTSSDGAYSVENYPGINKCGTVKVRGRYRLYPGGSIVTTGWVTSTSYAHVTIPGYPVGGMHECTEKNATTNCGPHTT